MSKEEKASEPYDPENTSKLYGDKPFKEPPRPGSQEKTPTSLPDAPDDVDENIFPSARKD